MHRTALLAVLAIAAVTGCSSTTKPATLPADTSSSSAAAPAAPAPTADQAMTVECTNITHAYNVWTEADHTAVSYKQRAAAESTFADAVSGYNDQPSKALAVAVTGLGFDLNLAAIPDSVGDKPDAATVTKISDDLPKVQTTYLAFVQANCQH
jgi:hypothetical protein